jgi:hypothetical protein
MASASERPKPDDTPVMNQTAGEMECIVIRGSHLEKGVSKSTG